MVAQKVSKNGLFTLWSFPQEGIYIKPLESTTIDTFAIIGTINGSNLHVDINPASEYDEDFGFKISNARAYQLKLTFIVHGLEDTIEV